MTRNCRQCGRNLGGHIMADGKKGGPIPGAVSICFYCQCLSFYDRDLALVAPTEEEMKELMAAPEVISALTIMNNFKKENKC